MMKRENILEDELDLVSLVSVIWSRRRFLIVLSGVFLLAGFVVAFTSPKEYKAEFTLILEAPNQGSMGGSLGGLASLAGVDLGGMTGSKHSVNPVLYKSVAESTPFLLELMKQEYSFSEVQRTLSIYEYYKDYYKTSLLSKARSLPLKILSIFQSKSENPVDSFAESREKVLTLSKFQHFVADDLRNRINVEIDWDLTIVTIEVEMQDPVVSALMADFTKKYITGFVTKYATSKIQKQLESIESQYQERKKKFENSQFKLASFRDRNRNVTMAQASSEEEKLQSEYDLAFGIYNQLAQQREAVILQLEEVTPVFTILEPVKVPISKSKPRRKLILIGMTFVGLVIGLVMVSFRKIVL